ncbi:MAG TPA: hypothetical protein VMF61_10025 [Candidatus Acidoferrales bacterium]|nr:hypothetical protein [Candidatus Acidoferrales bacterium]
MGREPVWQRSVPRELIDPRDALPPREIEPAGAQAETNFVVFATGWLPGDCTPGRTTLRPEQPPGRAGLSAESIAQSPHSENNACSLHTEIRGSGRRLRIKQFLYDWAPPTAGSATLWKTPWLQPVRSGDTAGWMGVDFKGNTGACIQRARTQIEVSVLEGTVGRDELARIVDGLREAEPRGALAVKQTPFHVLNYHVRFKRAGANVPYGLHRYEEPRRYDVAEPVDLRATAFRRIPSMFAGVTGFEIRHDSSVRMNDASCARGEDESLFRDAANESDHVWCSWISKDAADAYPARLEIYAEHPTALAEVASIRTVDAAFATLDHDYGGHEAFWETGGRRFAIWTSPSLRLDYRRFRAFVAAFVESQQPAERR